MADETLDDALEEERQGKLQHEVGQTPLPEDNDPPAAPPTEAGGQTHAADHPNTDSELDSTEVYDEGL